MSLAAVALRRKKRQRQLRGDSVSTTVVTPSGLLRLTPSPNAAAEGALGFESAYREHAKRRGSSGVYLPLAQVIQLHRWWTK